MGYFRDLKRDMFPPTANVQYNEYEGDYDADYYEADPGETQRNYKRNGRRMKIAGAIAAVAVVGGSLIVWASSDNKPRNSVSAEQTPSGDASIDSGSATASPSPSETESATESPSPSHTEEASPTPDVTSASPKPKKTHVVIPATPTPSATTSAPSEESYGACHINANATSVDYRHREAICDKPVTAYTDSDGATPAFEVNGPVEFNCLDAERGYVEGSISNAVGWIALPNLANDVCN